MQKYSVHGLLLELLIITPYFDGFKVLGNGKWLSWLSEKCVHYLHYIFRYISVFVNCLTYFQIISIHNEIKK